MTGESGRPAALAGHDLAVHNADSYAQFAFDAIGKADFNIERHRS